MKLSAYIIDVDSGFSPNPFGRHCTLACCKPTVRRKAERGDAVIAIASARYPRKGNLVYAMKVKEVITLQEYWEDPRFAYKKPSPGSPISERGDNIWHKEGRRWLVVPEAMHGVEQRKRDIGGENVLIATVYYYFGENAIEIQERFRHLLPITQGHKNCRNEETVEEFWAWVQSMARVENQMRNRGRFGDPSDFDGEACTTERLTMESDDVEEC